MPDVQEVFRMSTQKIRQDPGALDRQLTRQRRDARTRKLGTIALVVAIVAIAGSALGIEMLRGERTAPRDEPSIIGTVPTMDQLVGTWVRQNDGGDEPLFVLFKPDGTFAADDQAQVLHAFPAGAGTYRLQGDTITFTNTAAASLCQESDDWTWRATLLDEGRLHTVVVEDGRGFCTEGMGTESTWVQIPA